ncbi:MAG: branched-chain amino acid ABC transporter permease [archaeon]
MILPYLIHLLIIIAIYIIVSVSLNLALGYTGMLNLGHVALFGIGAYTSTLLVMNGVPFILAFILAGLLASIFGVLLVFATKKLKGDYYALATLGFSFVIYSLLVNLVGLTRGPQGISGIPRPNLFGLAISSNATYLIFAAFITLVSVFIIHKVIKSPFGRLLEATRDDELGLKVLGKNTALLKYKAMIISAFFAGIAGSLMAHYINFIDPSSYNLPEIIFVLTIVIIGGIASIPGSIAASFIIVLIPEVLRFFSLPSSILGPARQIIYAIILILIVMYRPRGLYGRIDLE